jgi:hypothetical protein
MEEERARQEKMGNASTFETKAPEHDEEDAELQAALAMSMQDNFHGSSDKQEEDDLQSLVNNLPGVDPNDVRFKEKDEKKKPKE